MTHGGIRDTMKPSKDMEVHTMKRGSFTAGFLTCLLLAGITTTAYAAGIMAERSTHRVFVDGREVQMEAYVINGNNYVKLRDIGEQVGFNVCWDSDAKCVQVESKKPYTGEAPVTSAEAKPVEQPAQTDVAAAKQDIIDRTNALRKENGVAVLRVNDRLMQAAQVRANEMATHTVYSHTRPDGRKFNTATDCPYMAENIHRIADWTMSNQTLAERAATDWYASTVHHKNMVNPKLSEIGVGLARGVNDTGDPCWYCVQLFLYDGYSITRVDTPTNK